MFGSEVAIGEYPKSTRPAMISGWKPPPRNGTCTALKPALRRNRSAVRCVVAPTPADA